MNIPCYHENTLRNAWILSKLYKDVLHIIILFQYDIDLSDLQTRSRSTYFVSTITKKCLDLFETVHGCSPQYLGQVRCWPLRLDQSQLSFLAWLLLGSFLNSTGMFFRSILWSSSILTFQTRSWSDCLVRAISVHELLALPRESTGVFSDYFPLMNYS